MSMIFKTLQRSKPLASFIRNNLFSTQTAVKCEYMTSASNVDLPITNKLHIVNTTETEKIPVYRVLGPDGKIVEGVQEPELSEELATNLYQMMVRIQCLDDVFYNAQRQGRISFYMQASGEEAIHIGKFNTFIILFF